MNSNTRRGVAGGIGFNFGYEINKDFLFGVKAIYSNDFKTVSSIEPALFIRYNLPLPVRGLYIQSHAGAVVFFEKNEPYPAFLAGICAGWRFLINNWYIEPHVRGGYPFAWGAGVTAGYRIPKTGNGKRAVAARRKELAKEITAILEEQNISNASIEITNEGVMIRLSNIQFIADSTRMPQTETAKIVDIAGILKAFPDRKILVAGHTAETGEGDRIDELKLSQDRAMVVMALLIQHGSINEKNISVIGYGPDRPIADNSTEEGKAANRRVEIVILE